MLENLRAAAKDRPADYAAGIMKVISRVESSL